MRLTRYILSRVYLYNPPPAQPAQFTPPRSRQRSHDSQGKRLRGDEEEEEPEANPWVLIVVLILAIAIMAGTTEWVSGWRLWRSLSD